jgi:phage-related minor tail protein
MTPTEASNLADFLAGGIGAIPADLFPGFANGGPVMGGKPIVVGERGPELFVPGSNGNVVPNNAMGGNTYAITVQAGVGDPRAIGQQIVEYVKKFEQANGPVFRAA